MKRSMNVLAALAAGAGIAAVGSTAASTVSANFVTLCSGQGGAVTVPGDLRVPAGETCSLDGTTVQGDVFVQAGANLIAEGVTLDGELIARNDAWVDLSESSVAGQVRLVNSYGYYGDTVDLGDDVLVNRNNEQLAPGMFLSYDSAIAGTVTARDGDIAIEGTTIAGNLVGNGAEFVDVIDTAVGGDLRVIATPGGSIVCDSEIYGNGLFRDNSGIIQLGGSGPYGDCVGADYWDGNVNINNNDAAVSLVENIVRGNLVGRGNDPQPVGEGNRVRGNAAGQFADLAPAIEMLPMTVDEPAARTLDTRTLDIEEAPIDADQPGRTGEIERDAEARRAEALAQAEEAGPAKL